MNIHVLYVLELKTNTKKFRLSVCLYKGTINCLQNLSGSTITFEEMSAFKQIFLSVFYV